MQAGHANVVNSRDRVAVKFRRQGCFLGNMHIRRAGTDHGDGVVQRWWWRFVPPQQLRHGVIFGVGWQVFQLIKGGLVQSRDKYTGALFHHAADDVRNLPRAFTGTKDHLCGAGTPGSVGI